ncbi:site-specific integrase [Bacteroides helcogenes]|uniref:Integrase family protein n=1 Tax=Bacteroides helcogenes (strain ATCC 35417 / DSM 20613 / JCM 6297 / CCUG 15421 / P 36-108) TaxID=693979 RepID=E6SRL7_BACT6|nr:site-specific integrase [Bacteroides helcogenes]ADV45107.1 integrase family protein [Bacteroides helcogenes P 36-108]MDY5238667.1 site-specific integrase [Bacteroides helcogenes]
MASIKVKYRSSTQEGKEGTIYYQVIHNRITRQIKTKYRLSVDEWNEVTATLFIPPNSRYCKLLSVKERIEWDVKRVENIIKQLENRHVIYTADDIVTIFYKQSDGQSFFNFMRDVIAILTQMNKHRTSETYKAALKSFMTFRENKDLLIDEVNSDLMQLYEAYLHNRGVTENSSSFYMRILRAVYNRAVEKELTSQKFPFRHVYTGISKTIKRAISFESIKDIKSLDLTLNPAFDFARDMFMFSFYTRGMSFIDIAYLKKGDINNGILTYRRRKTKQQLFIKWEKCMQDIVDKYAINKTSPYLLPILKYPNESRSQYRNTHFRINKNLKEIAKLLNISTSLTLYVARHSWASIAKSKNIPLSVISEGMGHDSETTTQIYLASLDSSVIDKANSFILKDLL